MRGSWDAGRDKGKGVSFEGLMTHVHPALNTDEFIPRETVPPVGWIEPKTAQHPESTIYINDFCSRPRRASPDTVLTPAACEMVWFRVSMGPTGGVSEVDGILLCGSCEKERRKDGGIDLVTHR